MSTSKTLDRQALYLALDDLRNLRQLSWAEVAEQTGVISSVLSELRAGTVPNADSLLLPMEWLDADLRLFRVDQDPFIPQT